MAWILPKGSTIYEKVNTFPGHRFDSIKTTSRDRKISDDEYELANRSDFLCDMMSKKRWSDYIECTGGYCKIDDLVHESAMPTKPTKSAKTSKATAKPKTPAAPKARKTPFRSLFVKGSEWKFKSNCTISIYREYESDYSRAIWAKTGAYLSDIKEIISANISEGVSIKPLGKSETYYPGSWELAKDPSGKYDPFTAIVVEIGNFKPGKEMRDGHERTFRFLVNIKEIENLVEQTNDFTPKAYIVEIDGEMYQENIYGYVAEEAKSEFIHMNPNKASRTNSWTTNLGIGCTSHYGKAKKYKTLQAAKAGIMYMTGYTEGADGIDYWTEGGGFTDWKKKWRISTWDKTTKTKVDDVDVTEWVYDLFKYRDLVQEYGAGTREIIKRLQAGEKFEAVMVLERWDEGAPVYDELLPSEQAEVSDLLKETILDKSQYLIRRKDGSVTIGFKSIGDAMMFKLAYNGTLGIRMFDLEKMMKVI